MNFKRSNLLRKRAQELIPGGAHTYSKGDDQFPKLSPGFIAHGKGSHVWDVDGNEFIDWGMGLRSVILGHAYKPILTAVKQQIQVGVNFTRPSPKEIELAQILTELIPSAQMVKFAKNGSDTTSAAVRLARAYTGKNIIARCKDNPFFSGDDWFIGDTLCDSGIPKAVKNLTKHFSYNNIQSLESLFKQYKNRIACVIMEPASCEEPKDQFLRKVKDLCANNSAILIFDEIITGFRWDIRGAQNLYGVLPDLSTFGKAIGNGFSISVLAGRKDIMELGGIKHSKEKVFLLSTTNGGEIHSLAAAIAVIKTMQKHKVIDHIWAIGKMLKEALQNLAQDMVLDKYVMATGVPCSPILTFHNHNGESSLELKTLFMQETIKNGILMPYVAPSYSHNKKDVESTIIACKKAFSVIKKAIAKGSVDGLLIGNSIKPVFRKYN